MVMQKETCSPTAVPVHLIMSMTKLRIAAENHAQTEPMTVIAGSRAVGPKVDQRK